MTPNQAFLALTPALATSDAAFAGVVKATASARPAPWGYAALPPGRSG